MSKAQGIANSANQGQFRNRIINRDCRIDQRNNGASVSMTTAAFAYAVDRTAAYRDTSATTTAQRSTVAPAGFTNSFLFTTTTGGTVSASNQNIIQQSIEGFNVADLGWGTANAQPITISFWVRSSLTGTYGVALTNSAATRCYVAAYSVISANTWEYKTITIVGDTTGTWLTDNGIGIRLRFDLGSGSTYQGTAGSWGTAFINTVSGQASVVGTSGATFYITGVQLEKSSTATSFDYRPYTTELQLCQRYYQKHLSSGGLTLFGRGYMPASASAYPIPFTFPVTMRSDPTVSIIGTWTTLNSSQPVSPNSTISKPGLYASSVSSGDSYAYASATAGFSASAEL